MKKEDELNLFIKKADELIESKYIFADVKITGLLKSIALSDVLMCMVESVLNGFNYDEVFARSFVKEGENPLGQYFEPESTKDLIALVFSVLLKIDGKEIDLAHLMKNYFYADGSVFNSYNKFVTEFIKPFKTSVKLLFEGVVSGKIKTNTEKTVFTKRTLPDDLVMETGAVTEVRKLIQDEKIKLLSSGLRDTVLADAVTLLSGIIAALDSGDKEALKVAFTGYSYFAENYKKFGLKPEWLRLKLERGKLI